MTKMELYAILNSKVIYRILVMKRESSIDISSSFLNSATSYRAFKNISFHHKEDYEKSSLRCNKRWRNRKLDYKTPHFLNFCVWKESMQLRYSIEMLVYATSTIAITYFMV